MKFFIDTADVDQIRTAYSWGILDGVTTNPTHVSTQGRPHKEIIQEICEIVPDGEISVEVVGMDCETMVKEAEDFVKSGKLVPDKIIVGMIKKRIENKNAKSGFILDGFPRNLPQAEALEEMLESIGTGIDG